MKLDTFSKQMFIHSDSVFESKNERLIAENFTRQWCDGPYRKPGMVRSTIRNYVFNEALANARRANAWPVFNKSRAALRVKHIVKPVLIMVGSLDVPFIISVGDYLHKQISHSQLYTINGTAHMINLEKPVEFKNLVSNFLSK